MKWPSLILLLLCLLWQPTTASAQQNTTTIILLRHAEKEITDSAATMMRADPPLSEAGRQRAQKLVELLAQYRPDAIYSTNFQRTLQTVTPLAQHFALSIQQYDYRNQQALAEMMAAQTGKTFVVVGHSNTIPALVNLLLQEPGAFADLDEREYGKLFIVTITDGRATVSVRQY